MLPPALPPPPALRFWPVFFLSVSNRAGCTRLTSIRSLCCTWVHISPSWVETAFKPSAGTCWHDASLVSLPCASNSNCHVYFDKSAKAHAAADRRNRRANALNFYLSSWSGLQKLVRLRHLSLAMTDSFLAERNQLQCRPPEQTGRSRISTAKRRRHALLTHRGTRGTRL
jgi:hypothetical protein